MTFGDVPLFTMSDPFFPVRQHRRKHEELARDALLRACREAEAFMQQHGRSAELPPDVERAAQALLAVNARRPATRRGASYVRWAQEMDEAAWALIDVLRGSAPTSRPPRSLPRTRFDRNVEPLR